MKVKYALVLSAVMLMVSMSSNASVLVRDTFYFKIYDATCQLRMAISDGYGNGVHSFAHMPGSACPGRSALMTTLTQVKKSRWHSFRTVAVYRGTGELYPNGAQGTRTEQKYSVNIQVG